MTLPIPVTVATFEVRDEVGEKKVARMVTWTRPKHCHIDPYAPAGLGTLETLWGSRASKRDENDTSMVTSTPTICVTVGTERTGRSKTTVMRRNGVQNLCKEPYTHGLAQSLTTLAETMPSFQFQRFATGLRELEL